MDCLLDTWVSPESQFPPLFWVGRDLLAGCLQYDVVASFLPIVFGDFLSLSLSNEVWFGALSLPLCGLSWGLCVRTPVLMAL